MPMLHRPWWFSFSHTDLIMAFIGCNFDAPSLFTMGIKINNNIILGRKEVV
jgi:hypothetical protein